MTRDPAHSTGSPPLPQPPAPRQSGRRWPWVAGLLLILAIAGVATAGVVFLDARHRLEVAAPAPPPDFEAIARAARTTTAALLSYEPDTVRQSLPKAADLLAGDFRKSYITLINDTVIPGAEQKRITAKGTVPAVGITTADDAEATVLLFVNQSITVGSDAPTDTADSVRVHLVNQNGRWLIDRFDPV